MSRPSVKSWFFGVGAGLLLAAPSAYALPALQIYSPDAVWDATHETWLITSSTFELWVIGDVGGRGEIYNVDLSGSGYGTAGTVTIMPILGGANLAEDPSPELNRPGYNGMTSNDEYAMADDHHFWTIGDFTSTADNIIDYQPGEIGSSTGEIKKFIVHVTGYDAVHFDAFDHYFTGTGAHQTTHYVFAPNSHDATSTTEELPEPNTMLLLGTGVLGLAFGVRRKR